MGGVMSVQQNAQNVTAMINGLKEQSMENWMLRVMAGDYGNINNAFNAWKETGKQGLPMLCAIGPVDATKISTVVSGALQAPFACFLGAAGSGEYHERILNVQFSNGNNGEWSMISADHWDYDKAKRLLIVGFDVNSDTGLPYGMYTNDAGINVLKISVTMGTSGSSEYPNKGYSAEVRVFTGGVV